MSHNNKVDKIIWTGVFFGLSLSVTSAFHLFKMAPVLSQMVQQFTYSPFMAGIYMSCYAFFGILLSKWFGGYIQKGKLHSVLRHLLFLTLCGACLGFIFPEYPMIMLLSRSLEGVGACGLAIAGPVIIARFIPKEKQVLAASIAAMWVPIGVIIAGLLSLFPTSLGFNVIHYDWQIEWVFSILLSGLLIIWGYYYQYSGISLSVETAAHGGRPEAPTPISLWDHKKHSSALSFAAMTFLLWACQNMAFMSWLPSYLIENLNYSQKHAALIFIAPVAFLGVFNLVAVPLMKVIPPTKLLFLSITGQAFSAAIILLTISSDGNSGNYGTIQLVFLLIYGGLSGITPSCLFRMPSLIFGQESTSKAFGKIMAGRNIGVFAGPMIVALALQYTPSAYKWESLGLVITAACILASLIGYHLHRKVLHLPND